MEQEEKPVSFESISPASLSPYRSQPYLVGIKYHLPKLRRHLSSSGAKAGECQADAHFTGAWKTASSFFLNLFELLPYGGATKSGQRRTAPAEGFGDSFPCIWCD